VSDKGYEVEKIFFNEHGNRNEHIRYLGTGDIDLRWNYKYDEDDNIIKRESYDVWENMKARSISVFDINRNEIERLDLNLKSGGDDKTTWNYDNANRMINMKKVSSKKNLITREIYTYDDINLIKISVLDNNENEISSTLFNYDSLNRKIKEVIAYKNMPSRIKSFKYDKNGNLIEIDGGYFRQEFKYDKKGNIVEDVMFNKDGGRQHKFINLFDHRGLIIERVRYDSFEKPAIFIRYLYEFH
jgi:uncharacterized protein YkuJ